MLVALSDLHFVDGTAGDDHISAGAFRNVLNSEIVALADASSAREIKLMLLGDVFDLLRSEQWLARDGQPFPLADRPWGERGLADVRRPRPDGATERRCLDILGQMPSDGGRSSVAPHTILHRHWETLDALRAFPDHARRRLGRDLPVEIVFVPGNHDRLVNVYPRVRCEVGRILGIAPRAASLQHWSPFPFSYYDEGHGVFARHGHQFDPWNFSARTDLSYEAHLAPTLGDVFAVEFAVKLPWLLKSMSTKGNGVTDAVIERLREMHNVRPVRHVLDWLRWQAAQGTQQQLRKALDEAVTAAIKSVFAIDFVHGMRGVDRRWDMLRAAMTRRGVRRVTERAVGALPGDSLLPFLLGQSRHEGSIHDEHIAAACREPILRRRDGARYVVYGHTHVPLEVPLGEPQGAQAFYINTGTWRERIFRTHELNGRSGFARLNHHTYAVFYRADEDVEGKHPGTESFEVRRSTRRKERLESAPLQA